MQPLRPIEAVKISDLTPAIPATGEPICEHVNPRTLFVDPEYQRSVGKRGLTQIRRIIQNFCWTKFKPPICAYAEDDVGRTVLKVLDGQHTAIAAASHPNIQAIPVMVVEAHETASQAAAFVGLNTERLGVTPLQLHQASVVAGNEDALDVENVCRRAGVTVLRTPPSSGHYRPRETIAVTTIRGLVSRHTAVGARQILEVLANADLTPITSLHIKAAEHLMSDPDYSQKFEAEELTKTIVASFLTAEDEAKILAKSLRTSEWRALATLWFRKTKKKRYSVRIAA